MPSQTPTGINYGENGGTSDTFYRYKIHIVIAFYSGVRSNQSALIEVTPMSAVFMHDTLAECFIPDMYSDIQLDPIQVTQESCEQSQHSQPPQAEHAQYHTPSDTMSSPDGSVGQLTPSPKRKAKSTQNQRQSGLRNQYVPTPTAENHNTIETPDDTNDPSASHMSAEAMSIKDLQTFGKQTSSSVKNTHPSAGTFTKGNNQSNTGPHCGQNLGYQDGQPAYNPQTPFYPLNQPINTSQLINPVPSGFGSASSIAHIYPPQQIPVVENVADNVNPSDANSMVASATSKVRRTVPITQVNPQKQTPVAEFRAHRVKSSKQPQASSPSSNSMPQNSQPMKAQKEASHHQQSEGYYHRLLRAMNDIENAQDNAGMVDSWEKKMNTSQTRIRQVCRELVEKVFQAQERSPRALSDNGKPPSKIHNTADERMDKLESVLATQKTICKHLLEDSYINRVVTDPTHAQHMVENNRRVNYQKKQDKDELNEIRGVEGRGKGHPIRQVRKPRKQQEESGEESGDECQGTSGNTNNSPENQGSQQGRPRSKTKRGHTEVGDDDNVNGFIKISPSKRAKKNTHGRTKSASALNINMVAASPMNVIGAGRASAHRHSNSYPGNQSTNGDHTSPILVDTPTSGLPYTFANPQENFEYNEMLRGFSSGGFRSDFGHVFDSVPATPDNPYTTMYTQGYDMSGNLHQSPQADN